MSPLAVCGGPLCFVALALVSASAAAQDDASQLETAEAPVAADAQSPSKDAKGVFDPAGFGLYLWLGGGIGEGDYAAPQREVYGPKALINARMEMSYSYVYLGLGLGSLYFDDEAPISEEVVYTTTGGDAGTTSASASGTTFDVELGAAHSFLLSSGDWALRPGLGLGWQTSPEVTRLLECKGCDSEVVLDAYEGGPFARAQLGFHRRFPTVVGVSLLYQQFLGEVPNAALSWTLMAGLVFAVDGHR